MKPGGLVVVAIAAAVLSGCAVPTALADPSPLLPSEVSADSPPAFLDDPIDPEHPLPDEVATSFNVDPADARYQGEWYGEGLYLSGTNGTVRLIGVDLDDPELWHAGGGLGNSPFAMESGDTTDDEWMLQYLPQGTADLPDGWTAFSPWLASRDL